MAILSLPSSQWPKKKAGGSANRERFLVTVNVLGSAGHIRFLVTDGDLVANVIATVLRSYARQGRLPVLGSNPGCFLLYSVGSDAMSLSDRISAKGTRNFMMCKKQQMVIPQQAGATAAGMLLTDVPDVRAMLKRKRTGGSWKSWIDKSLSFVISTH